MDCPVCHLPMVVFEYQNIELDYCAECFGVWFDAGEIELLWHKAGNRPDGIAFSHKKPDTSVSEAKRPCPICQKTMKKIQLTGSDLILDECSRGHGIWFDRGEILPALKSYSQTGSQDIEAVIRFLGKALVTNP